MTGGEQGGWVLDGGALAGVRATVVGLAREGVAVARFLAGHGARVTVTDAKGPDTLGESIAQIAGLPIQLALGGHPVELLDASDLLFVSPGVPLDIPFLVEARRRGLPLGSETRLFARLCAAPVAGITGSSGKTTTTALVGEMLRAAGHKTWVGGNIGQPLLAQVTEITASDRVVVELSSFQLDLLGPWPETTRVPAIHPALADPAGWSPHLAAILNIRPNHLDRHGTMAAYTAAKTQIVAHQRAGDVAVLNLDDPTVRAIGQSLSQDVAWFSLEQPVERGAFLRPGAVRADDELVLRRTGPLAYEAVVCRRGDVRLLGDHNLANLLAACAVAAEAGVPLAALRQVATTFGGVEHRLELVRQVRGARWYNDSIATSPERTLAALRSFDAPVILLAGGRDKHLSWDEMARVAWRRARHVILFGEAAAAIERALSAARAAALAAESGAGPEVHLAGTLERAVALAARISQPGDVVLLSPGGTSFDAYSDFVERGEHFRRLVETLE